MSCGLQTQLPMKLRSNTLLHATVICAFGLMGASDAMGQKKKIKDLPSVSDPGGNCDTSAYKLVFHDEFEGTALDRKKWITYFPFSEDGSENCEACRYMGGTNSIFMEDQVTVQDGILKLDVSAEPTTWYNKTTEHRGSTIRSIGSAEFTYGKFEIRCKLPQGTGLWPAFWMFGGKTEIDAFEVCMEKPKWIKGSLHQWGETRTSNTGKYKGVDYSSDFHTYSVEWDQDEIRWYVDNEKIYTRGRYVDKRGRPYPGCDRGSGTRRIAPYFPRPEDKVNVIAGNGVSEEKGFCKGPKEPIAWGPNSAMLVDYIRVYQRTPQKDLSDLCIEPKKLSISPSNATLQNADQRQVVLNGAHGSLQWECSEGLQITERTINGVSVKAVGKAGKQWIRVISANGPCSNEQLILEEPLEIVN